MHVPSRSEPVTGPARRAHRCHRPRVAAFFVTLAVSALALGCGRIGYESRGSDSVPAADAMPFVDASPPNGDRDAGDTADAAVSTPVDAGIDVRDSAPPVNMCAPPCGPGMLCCDNMCVPDNPAPC